jgi:DNA-binding HxlR family transcriptional regulator
MISSMIKPVGCVKAATIILGDKWTPLLLTLLANNPTSRFSQLQEVVEGINPRTLSARLLSLEEKGIVEKLPVNHTNRCEYKLTQKGHDLLPILRDMEKWGEKYSPTNL